MAKGSRTAKVYLRLLKRDIVRSARKLLHVRRYKNTQLVITLTRPSFRTSRAYFKKWRAQPRRSSRGSRAALASLGLIVVGVVGVGWALMQLSAAQPTMVSTVEQVQAKQQPAVEKQAPVLARSVPTRLAIPDISVDTSLIQLGQNADGTLETPEEYDVAGWYRDSPTPGELGPSVIVGHVDNYQGAAVFFRLKELQPGQKISIYREDGSVAEFSVTQVAQFDQDNFPTDAVYGNIDHAGLRLITCGGPFDHINQRYTQNTVVYATYSAPIGG